MRLMHGEAASHAEMHQQYLPPGKARQQILAAALQPLDLPTFQGPWEIIGKRKSQVRPVLVYPREGAADKRGLKAASHDLDFGQLRHGDALGYGAA
jgi:hypothetical protein